LRPGKEAPAFSLRDKEGRTVSLSDFKGKVVYLDFWGVYCGPCISDIKNTIPKVHEKYKGKDVVFINICVDVEEAEWKEKLSKLPLDGINLLAAGWTKNPVCQAYDIKGIPHYVLIDQEGKIVDNNGPSPQVLLSSQTNLLDKLLDR
jgi:peroxiredoxin